MANKKNTIASCIYANIAAKHPEWSQKRVYTATKWALENRNTKKVEEAPAEVAEQ